jgi:cytochrome c-type biogenesis protein CcmE
MLGAGTLVLASAAALVLTAFEDNLVFFHSPTDLATKAPAPGLRLRVGGLVEQGSVIKNGNDILFKVTDLSNTVTVVYRGLLPDLFREGQGIVAEGQFKEGVFMASEVLAKHDETYMPPEVADAIKRAGQWKPETK